MLVLIIVLILYIFYKMKILELIFTNISLQAYTILSTILFTTLFYLVIIFLVKFYSTDSDNEENKKGTHVIIKIFILLFSIVAATVTQGVIAELYFFKDWECSMRSSCIK